MGDIDFDLSRSLKVQYGVIGLPLYGSLLMVNSNIGPKSAPLRDIGFKIWVTLTLIFQGHPWSNASVSLDSPSMVPIDGQ